MAASGMAAGNERNETELQPMNGLFKSMHKSSAAGEGKADEWHDVVERE